MRASLYRTLRQEYGLNPDEARKFMADLDRVTADAVRELEEL
jgi:hypothetical protein